MTKAEAQILESIAALPEAERRRLVKFLIETNMDRPSFISSMTPEQRQGLQEGIEQAERGEYSPAAEVFARLKRGLQTP
jgi:predicted transcriptional regulator